MEPEITVDMRTVRDLDNSLELLALATGKSIGQVVEQASFWSAQSAAKVTKMARKKIRTNGRLPASNAFGAVGWVHVWIKNVFSTRTYSTEASYQKARPTPRRKLAKNAWIASARTLRRTPLLENPTYAKRYSRAKVQKRGEVTEAVALVNQLNYIKKIAPNAPRIAVHKTDKRVQGYLKRVVERRLLKGFGRGAAAIRGL